MKDPVKRKKRQPTAWEKLFAKHIPDKGLGPEYIKNSETQQSYNPKNPIIKWAKDMNRRITKAEVQVSNKHTKNTFNLIHSPEGNC